MKIPSIFQSSIDESQVSLTIASIGKAGAGFITFLAVVGLIDPTIAGQTWGNFISAVITAIPAGYAVWHTGQAVWGLVRKAAVTVVALFNKPTPPTA